VRSQAPLIHTVAVEDSNRGLVTPNHCREALSTDRGLARVPAF